MNTREAVVLGPNGSEILDLDPVELEASGPVASAYDDDLELILIAMDDYADKFGVDGLKLVWSDDNSDVLAECPTCGCVKSVASFTAYGVADFLVCGDCAD